MNELAKRLSRHFLDGDPEIEARVSEGIEANRKGFGSFELKDAQGRPVEKARIKLRQTGHEFNFGCNLFMLGEFPEPGQNAAYEEAFKSLFNLAVVPFYWSDLEPEDGKPRFAKGSPKAYRRPPPDLCLEYCERNGIRPKGHPLLWHLFWPAWLKGSKKEIEARIVRRFREIAERYADRIKIWDACNEAQTVYGRAPLPDSHVDFAFEQAAPLFPGSVLTYNDDRIWWNLQGDYSPVYLLVKSLLDKGLKVGGLGLQYHMFEGLLHGENEYFMKPSHLFACLDQYAKLGVPVNFSEISVISRRDLGDGDQFQALVTEKLYRLAFSHASVNGLVWWNLVDGTAAFAPMGSEQGENSLRAGLLNYDFTPKKAFLALKRMIKDEWSTATELSYENGAFNKFRGFYGDYDVEIETDAGAFKKSVRLSKGFPNKFNLELS